MPSREDRDRNSDKEKDSRFLIAKIVLPISMGGVVLLALILIVGALERNDVDAAKWALAVAAPVVAAWAAAIISYYFTQKSFESASRNVTETVERLTGVERLKSIRVKDKMIVRRDITALNITSSKPASKIKLIGDILKLLDDSKKNRLPILDENDHPLYIVHRSMIDKYLTRKITKDKLTPEKLNNLTLEDLLNDDADLKRMFEATFGTVAEDATLADAKILIDKLLQCLDVFVTENGTKNEPIIGWLTNLIIAESAKV